MPLRGPRFGLADDRASLTACTKALRKGDTLVIWKLDRLGRDRRHPVNLIHDLTSRNIGLKVLAGEGAAIDTTTPTGEPVFGIFGGIGGVRASAGPQAHEGWYRRGAQPQPPQRRTV